MTREEAIQIIKYLKGDAVDYGLENKFMQKVVDTFDTAIEALEQEPKTGHWIGHREHCEMNNLIPIGLVSYFWCSECNCGIDSESFGRVNYNYCPECGAKMTESED